MWARVLGSQRSYNTAVFGHRFCKSRALFSRLRGVHRIHSLPSNLANFLSVSPFPLSLPAPSFLPSIVAVQISQVDFILVSRIFFIASDPGAFFSCLFFLSPFAPSRVYVRVPYVIKCRQQCICVRYKERRLTSEAHVPGLTYWTVYTLRVFMPFTVTETYWHPRCKI